MGIDWLPTIVEFTQSQSPKIKLMASSLSLITGKHMNHLMKISFLLQG